MAIILQHINVPSQSLVHLTFSQFYMSNVFQFLKSPQIKGELPWKKELCLPDPMMPSTQTFFRVGTQKTLPCYSPSAAVDMH